LYVTISLHKTPLAEKLTARHRRFPSLYAFPLDFDNGKAALGIVPVCHDPAAEMTFRARMISLRSMTTKVTAQQRSVNMLS